MLQQRCVQFFKHWEAKPKPIAPCTRDVSCAFSKLQVIARNSDWFIPSFAPVVIGRINYFDFGFSKRSKSLFFFSSKYRSFDFGLFARKT